jgi:hypothetical protein
MPKYLDDAGTALLASKIKSNTNEITTLTATINDISNIETISECDLGKMKLSGAYKVVNNGHLGEYLWYNKYKDKYKYDVYDDTTYDKNYPDLYEWVPIGYVAVPSTHDIYGNGMPGVCALEYAGAALTADDNTTTAIEVPVVEMTWVDVSTPYGYYFAGGPVERPLDSNNGFTIPGSPLKYPYQTPISYFSIWSQYLMTDLISPLFTGDYLRSQYPHPYENSIWRNYCANRADYTWMTEAGQQSSESLQNALFEFDDRAQWWPATRYELEYYKQAKSKIDATIDKLNALGCSYSKIDTSNISWYEFEFNGGVYDLCYWDTDNDARVGDVLVGFNYKAPDDVTADDIDSIKGIVIGLETNPRTGSVFSHQVVTLKPKPYTFSIDSDGNWTITEGSSSYSSNSILHDEIYKHEPDSTKNYSAITVQPVYDIVHTTRQSDSIPGLGPGQTKIVALESPYTDSGTLNPYLRNSSIWMDHTDSVVPDAMAVQVDAYSTAGTEAGWWYAPVLQEGLYLKNKPYVSLTYPLIPIYSSEDGLYAVDEDHNAKISGGKITFETAPVGQVRPWLDVSKIPAEKFVDYL